MTLLLLICFAVCFACFFYMLRKKANKYQYKEVNGKSIRYHYFVWSLLIPSWFITGIYDYITNWSSYQVFPLSLFAFIEFITCIMLLISFIGFFKFTKYSWFCIVIEILIDTIIGLILEIISLVSYDINASEIIVFVITETLNILTLIYYFKRKDIFGNKNIRNSKYDSPMLGNNILYCRKCGTKLITNSEFCHYCGEKVDSEVEEDKKYMYICRNCKQTYSSDLNKASWNCTECNHVLEQMPIFIEDWIKLSDDEKETYKINFLKASKESGYISKTDTPLAWHNFSRYFRAPFALLQLLLLNSDFGIFNIISLVLIGMFFIGSFSWKRYAWVAIILADSLSICTTFLAFIINVTNSQALSAFLSVLIVDGLEILYYKKREKLFDGKKIGKTRVEEINEDIENDIKKQKANKETIEQSVEKIEKNENKSVENEANSKIDETKQNIKNTDTILFCKKCGAKLSEDEIYCHKCGNKIERE